MAATTKVTTIEPAVRPDGLRGSPAQFAVLDRRQATRRPRSPHGAGRSAFESLVGEADLLVESFSSRVMPNLGYGADALRAINPRLAIVAIRAFPALRLGRLRPRRPRRPPGWACTPDGRSRRRSPTPTR